MVSGKRNCIADDSLAMKVVSRGDATANGQNGELDKVDGSEMVVFIKIYERNSIYKEKLEYELKIKKICRTDVSSSMFRNFN